MTRMVDLVADTRRIAYGSMADQLNFLTEEAPLGAAELKLALDLTGITPGMVLSSGLNVYYVVGVVANEKKVLVYPTYDNSRNDALPIGSPVMIRPRVTDWHIFNLLNNAITQMSSRTNGLYRIGSWVDTSERIWNTFPIPVEAQGMISLVRVYEQVVGYSDDVWVDVSPNSVKWQPGLNEIRLTKPVRWGRNVRFEYMAPFKEAVSLTDDVVVDCGLSETMVDIPPLGAAASLLRTTESRRANVHAQGDPRRADEVSAGSNANAAREIQRKYEDRIDDEYVRLVNRNSIRQSL